MLIAIDTTIWEYSNDIHVHLNYLQLSFLNDAETRIAVGPIY